MRTSVTGGAGSSCQSRKYRFSHAADAPHCCCRWCTVAKEKNSMKVVIFCGVYGMRLREYSEEVPKPMVPIGYRPVLWPVMKYYAHFGHKDFILCLGYRADAIKQYFLNYDECLSNDFTLSGAVHVALANSRIHEWKTNFVDPGMS